jgi:hypothetical protein
MPLSNITSINLSLQSQGAAFVAREIAKLAQPARRLYVFGGASNVFPYFSTFANALTYANSLTPSTTNPVSIVLLSNTNGTPVEISGASDWYALCLAGINVSSPYREIFSTTTLPTTLPKGMRVMYEDANGVESLWVGNADGNAVLANYEATPFENALFVSKYNENADYDEFADAYNALPATGGTIILDIIKDGDTPYRPYTLGFPFLIDKPNVSIIGLVPPVLDFDTDSWENEPAIIRGSLQVRASGFTIRNVGFETDPIQVRDHLALTRTAALAANKSAVIENVAFLGDARDSLYHCLRVENYDNVYIRNVQTINYVWGVALKSDNISFSGLRAKNNNFGALITKADFGLTRQNINVSDVLVENTADGGGNYYGGIVVQSLDSGSILRGVNFSDVVIRNGQLKIENAQNAPVNGIDHVQFTNLDIDQPSHASLAESIFYNSGVDPEPCSGVIVFSNVTLRGALTWSVRDALSSFSNVKYTNFSFDNTFLGVRNFDVSARPGSGTRAVVLNSSGNTATAQDSLSGGNSSDATGQAAIALGNGVDATGTASFAEGNTTLSSGFASHAEGSSTIASATGAHAEGSASNAYLRGSHASAAGSFAVAGDAQFHRVVARRTSSDATPVRLTSDGNAPTSGNYLALPANRYWAFTARISGVKTDGAKSYHTIQRGVIKRLVNTTSLVGSIQTIGTDIDEGAPGYSVAITADDTNEALNITATGATSESIRWVAIVEFLEIGNA